MNYSEARFNLVRLGIILYGYAGAYDTFEKISLKPIAELKAKVVFLKEVLEGTSIGYSRSYITTRETFMKRKLLIVNGQLESFKDK